MSYDTGIMIFFTEVVFLVGSARDNLFSYALSVRK